jgi:hypothetical protein
METSSERIKRRPAGVGSTPLARIMPLGWAACDLRECENAVAALRNRTTAKSIGVH